MLTAWNEQVSVQWAVKVNPGKKLQSLLISLLIHCIKKDRCRWKVGEVNRATAYNLLEIWPIYHTSVLIKGDLYEGETTGKDF